VIGAIAYGDGYLLVASDGAIFALSNRPFFGSLSSTPPPNPVVGVRCPPTAGADLTIRHVAALSGSAAPVITLAAVHMRVPTTRCRVGSTGDLLQTCWHLTLKAFHRREPAFASTPRF
jgi:hypothetical protein